MRASRAQWALVTLSMLGLAGCQSGKSWWPSRNKMPPYSAASQTPPAGVPQNQLPSAQAAPYGAETANQYAQQTGGYAGNPADAYGANNYMNGASGDPYANATAGAMPQTGPYNADGYQQPAGGTNGYGGNGYGGAAGAGYAAEQMNNPYATGGAGGQGYAEYQGQPQSGYPAQQAAGDYNGAGYADPAGATTAYTADARSAYGQPQADYNAGAPYGGGAGYGQNPAMPEQAPYGAGDANYGQGAGAGNYNQGAGAGNYGQGAGAGDYGQGAGAVGDTGYPPGETNYQPGNTGYNPPGVPPYTPPGASYNADPGMGGSEPHYRPGGTGDYSTGGTGASGAGAAGYDNSGTGNASGYGNPGAASTSRYPSSSSTGGYSNSGGQDRYGRPTSGGIGAAASQDYYPQR